MSFDETRCNGRVSLLQSKRPHRHRAPDVPGQVVRIGTVGGCQKSSEWVGGPTHSSSSPALILFFPIAAQARVPGIPGTDDGTGCAEASGGRLYNAIGGPTPQIRGDAAGGLDQGRDEHIGCQSGMQTPRGLLPPRPPAPRRPPLRRPPPTCAQRLLPRKCATQARPLGRCGGLGSDDSSIFDVAHSTVPHLRRGRSAGSAA